MISRRPALALIAIVAACLGVGAAVPSSAHLVRAEPLGAVTTITATSSGSASLVLYDDATVSAAYTHNPDVTISGSGRLVGFDLVSDSNPNYAQDNDELTAERVPAFAGTKTLVTGMSGSPRTCSNYPNDTVPVKQECSGCTYVPSPMVPAQENCTYATPKVFKLHEGYYHLAVLADGAPLRITIRLHGIGKGHAKVHLQSSFRSLETTMTPHESIGTSTITFGSSATFPSADQIMLVFAVKLHPKATLLADSECLRSDTSAPPPYAYSPACPGGQTMSYAYQLNTGVGDGGFGTGGVGVFGGGLAPTGNPDPNGVGGSFVDSDGPTYVGGLSVWVHGAYLPFFVPVNP